MRSKVLILSLLHFFIPIQCFASVGRKNVKDSSTNLAVHSVNRSIKLGQNCSAISSSTKPFFSVSSCGVTNGSAFFAGIVFGPPTIITLVGNSVMVAQKRYSKGWGINGIVFGSLGFLTHTAIAIAALSTPDCNDMTFTLGMNIPMILLNITTIALSITTLRMPVSKQQLFCRKKLAQYRIILRELWHSKQKMKIAKALLMLEKNYSVCFLSRRGRRFQMKRKSIFRTLKIQLIQQDRQKDEMRQMKDLSREIIPPKVPNSESMNFTFHVD